jgi:hypothetical protein
MILLIVCEYELVRNKIDISLKTHKTYTILNVYLLINHLKFIIKINQSIKV